ncbi:unnamed protein product [Rotaria sp. Silwood1]|nr:unnamed protein product [Rotaria sp. Silwood1]
MRRLVGIRRGCTLHECKFNLCEQCLVTNNHEHSPLEYLMPQTPYIVEQHFVSVPYLLSQNNNERLETKIIWESGAKAIALYFSAHWCSPCHYFTRTLVNCY